MKQTAKPIANPMVVLREESADQAVLFHPDTGHAVGTNAVGVAVWKRLDGWHIPEMVFGTVGADRLEKVWQENDILQELRAGLPHRLEGMYARCLMKQHCLGACVAQNYYRTGSLWASFWFCEEAAAAGLFPALRLET